MLPRWSGLRQIGQIRILRTSYAWIFLVPIAAKTLAKMNEFFTINIGQQTLVLDTTLPFSWQMFYFSSVSVAIACVIYSWRCPSIVKDYPTFAHFASEYRAIDFLRNYAANCRITSQRLTVLETAYASSGMSDRQLLADAFWEIRAIADSFHPKSRFCCALLYLIGFGLFSAVLIQNFLYVAKAIL